MKAIVSSITQSFSCYITMWSRKSALNKQQERLTGPTYMRPVESACLEVGWGSLYHDIWVQSHESLLGVTEKFKGDEKQDQG